MIRWLLELEVEAMRGKEAWSIHKQTRDGNSSIDTLTRLILINIT